MLHSYGKADIINRRSPADGFATVEQITKDGYQTVGKAKIRFEGNQLMLSVQKTLPGLGENSSFRFKWADNCDPADLYNYYTHGDSAPYGRLNWVYGQ